MHYLELQLSKRMRVLDAYIPSRHLEQMQKVPPPTAPVVGEIKK